MKLKNSCCLIGIISLFFISLLAISIAVYVQIGLKNEQYSENANILYRYREYNPLKGKSKVGYITLPQKIGIEHLSYVEEGSDSNILISSMGSHEFECKGTCLCDDDINSNELNYRRFSNIISKPLYLLIGAASTLFAINIAKNMFDQQCKQLFSDSCSPNFISFEVETCEKMFDRVFGKDVKEDVKEDEESAEELFQRLFGKDDEVDDEVVREEEEYVIGLITHNNFEEAKILAEKLVENKLVACVNMIPKIYSIYSWKGNIEKSEEVLMIIKTRKELKNEIIEFVRKHHPYECPEIIFTDIKSGYTDYLNWIGDQTKKS